jgi:apolipoprotein N-acyltransferase
VKQCPICSKQARNDTWLCDCGYEFDCNEKPHEQTRTVIDSLLVFLMSLLPVTGLFLWLIGSSWIYNQYGFFGAWIIIPAILLCALFILTGIYFCSIFISGSIAFRIIKSLLLGIFGVIIPLVLCTIFSSLFPHSHHGI